MTTPSRTAVPRLGAWYEGTAVCLRTWAPDHREVEVVRYDAQAQPARSQPLTPEPGGFFFGRFEEAGPFLYKLRLDGQGPFPDPWSRAQPLGVHGPSAPDRATFDWTDGDWRGVPLADCVLYEVHVGTATAEGTFDALAARLPMLAELGVTAVELLPLASFPGRRNWGYDGVSLFAPAQVYGGPDGLRRFVDAAHRARLAVIVDAVYNHFGPDGNYLRAYSQAYFTGKHHTPWGDAVNYSEPSSVVRELALSNAEMWIRDYHVDGLRLDATHAIIDERRPHLLEELSQRARAAAPGRQVLLMAEDERNERRLLTAPREGGHGLDAVWADDFHHQLRRAFAGDDEGYYRDYTGSTEDLARTLRDGWFYRGQVSTNLGHARGTSPEGLPPERFIHCIQNHDQVGNRPLGNRLAEDVSPAAFRAMSALLLLSPCTPLLFAGQEWNARTPFLYFTDHHEELGRLVTEGRRKEFAGFSRFSGEEVPDPQADDTFLRSKLDWREAESPEGAGVRALYVTLFGLRREHPALRNRERGSFEVRALGEDGLVLERRGGGKALQLVVALRASVEAPLEEQWRLLLDTEAPRFAGRGFSPPSRLAGRLTLEGPRALLLEKE